MQVFDNIITAKVDVKRTIFHVFNLATLATNLATLWSVSSRISMQVVDEYEAHTHHNDYLDDRASRTGCTQHIVH